jgi:penicillin-insensitive murein endopeptidase
MPVKLDMRRMLRAAGVVAGFLAAGVGSASGQDEPRLDAVAALRNGSAVAAKALFGAAKGPAPLAARAIGSYARGCLSGARALPVDGPAWQVMRLSRNRNWGHPQLVALVERLAADARRLDGWPGLLVGDLAQPRGGPMVSGHASHQIGLDADIWLNPAPGRVLTAQEREEISAVSVVKDHSTEHAAIDEKVWTEAHARLLMRAASYREVARIFVHPPIKKALCDWAKGDRGWLAKIRPYYGHNYHFHIRIRCPERSDGCQDQAAPPGGDGCGDLAWWLGPEPWRRAKGPFKPKPPMALADLPADCRSVLTAQ